MKSFCLFSLFFRLFLGVTFALDKPCGDWVPFKDEKCFTVYDSMVLQNFTEAEATCAAHDNGKLISITTKDEQDFLVNFLFKQKQVVDNLWLGAKVFGSVFHWEDGTNLTFSNWVSGEPKNQADHCAQMNGEGETKGKWVEEPCKKKNLVVCQKGQTLSLARMQERLLKVEKNPVPLGFIYVQLPKEQAPVELWPSLTWTEVSSSYEGVFFRVAGGGAADFGEIQPENAPKLTQVDRNACQSFPTASCEKYKFTSSQSIPSNGSWSDPLEAAVDYVTHIYGIDASKQNKWTAFLNFRHSTGEVRPKNMAVKVWKRTG